MRYHFATMSFSLDIMAHNIIKEGIITLNRNMQMSSKAFRELPFYSDFSYELVS